MSPLTPAHLDGAGHEVGAVAAPWAAGAAPRPMVPELKGPAEESVPRGEGEEGVVRPVGLFECEGGVHLRPDEAAEGAEGEVGLKVGDCRISTMLRKEDDEAQIRLR